MSFTIPNLLSLLRMALVPPFIIALINGQAKRALLIVVLAGISDALDGFIARFFHQQSLLGSYLDPLADKLLVTAAYIILALPALRHGGAFLIPAWVTVVVIARDVLLVVVALVLYLAANVRSFPPSLLSKITTVFQFGAVVVVLSTGVWPELDVAALVLVHVVAILTIASGLLYVWRANRLFDRHPPHQPPTKPAAAG
ncbi:MAG TPA: CDP-alcohol phosphatidyltransferase family protein [Thermoanaerobaculia bacterium]|jgi:cardiolipin synthase|nr:CDP-alcohol phosphatidyltransferase family protein [Thermoanaerobaculia bacterium]